MLTYRKYNAEDKESCIRLLRAGHDPKFSVERFDWLHHQNPLAPSNIVLAVDGKHVAGFYGALKKNAIIDGKNYVVARDIDPVVDKNYRGQGIFTKMLDFVLESFTDIDFFYNFANRISTPGFLKKGWTQIGPLRDYVSQLGFNKVFSRQFAMQSLSYNRRDKKKYGNLKQIKFEVLENEDDFNPIEPKEKIWVKRDLEFLKWRYISNPMYKYDFHEHRDEYGKLNSICISRLVDKEEKMLILDYVQIKGKDYGLSPFLSYFREKFDSIPVYIWQTSTKSMLKGFITNPTKKKVGQNFLVRQFPGKSIPDCIYNIENWYVSRGDSEVF